VTVRPSFFLRLSIAIVCPILAAVAFPKTNLTPLAFVALAPVFWLWSVSSWRAALGWGVLSGTIMFAALDSWMIYSIGDEIGSARFVALVLLAGSESIFIAAAAVLTSLIARGRFGTATVFAAPAAWLITESIRTNGSVSMPFAHLGAVAAHAPWLLPMAAFAGIYGLTAIVALCNGAVAGVLFGDASTRVTAAVALGCLIVVVALGDEARARIALPPADTKVAIAQGDISQRVKWSPAIFEHTVGVYADLTRTAAAGGARIVIWPETAITDYPLQKPEVMRLFHDLVRQQRIWLVAGTVDSPQRGEIYNVIMTLDPNGIVRGVYRKHILVPFAEFLPFDTFFRELPGFDQASKFAHGPGAQVLDVDGTRFGALICFESAYSSYARETAALGAQSLLIVTDDAWFGPTSGPVIHADLAKIDAVETGRWVVRGADTGISQFIDPRGRVVAELPLDRAGVLVARIGPPIDTPYQRFGAAWLEALVLITLLIAAVVRPAAPKKRRA
jgi:apolipoprotein N-acyltransferase